MAGRTRLSRVTRLASRGGRSGRMFRSGARSALHRSPLLRDAARGARARVPDCVLRLRPPARHRFPSRRHERHPRQGLSASESLKLRALRPHAFRTDSRPSASLKLLFSETHKMEMTHYMELMMGSWHMLVLFMAAPMLLAECYVVSEILLLIKPPQGGALAAFNKASAYAAALGIALLSGCVALQFSSVVAWRTWVDAVSALAYVAAGLPFIYVGLLEAASSPAAGRPSGRDARPSRRWSSISSSPTPPWSSGCSIPCSSAGGLLRRALRPCARMLTLRPGAPSLLPQPVFQPRVPSRSRRSCLRRRVGRRRKCRPRIRRRRRVRARGRPRTQ